MLYALRRISKIIRFDRTTPVSINSVQFYFEEICDVLSVYDWLFKKIRGLQSYGRNASKEKLIHADSRRDHRIGNVSPRITLGKFSFETARLYTLQKFIEPSHQIGCNSVLVALREGSVLAIR